MVKLEHDGTVYYFESFNSLYGAINDDDPWKRQTPNKCRLKSYARFVVVGDTIIKSRVPVTTLIDSYMEEAEKDLP